MCQGDIHLFVLFVGRTSAQGPCANAMPTPLIWLSRPDALKPEKADGVAWGNERAHSHAPACISHSWWRLLNIREPVDALLTQVRVCSSLLLRFRKLLRQLSSGGETERMSHTIRMRSLHGFDNHFVSFHRFLLFRQNLGILPWSSVQAPEQSSLCQQMPATVSKQTTSTKTLSNMSSAKPGCLLTAEETRHICAARLDADQALRTLSELPRHPHSAACIKLRFEGTWLFRVWNCRWTTRRQHKRQRSKRAAAVGSSGLIEHLMGAKQCLSKLGSSWYRLNGASWISRTYGSRCSEDFCRSDTGKPRFNFRIHHVFLEAR